MKYQDWINQGFSALLLKRLRWISISILAISIIGCKEETVQDTIPPADVTEITSEPLNGGVMISYKSPSSVDLHYVKAVYMNSQGEEVFKVSSFYNNSIELDGFNDTVSHSAVLYSVDRSNNHSKGISVEFKPLISHIHLVKEDIAIEPALGGVTVSWENPGGKQVFVFLYYENSGYVEERILSSDKESELFSVRGLDSIEYNFSVLVEDFNGNKTDIVSKGSYTPWFEEKIEKGSWTLIQALSVDGDAWEGLNVNFFDDVVDTKDSPADNSYFIINRDRNGGFLNFPLDIVIDLNKQAIVNRFVVWQRAYWYSAAESQGISENYYYYQGENMRSFDLWASNDQAEWLLLGSFDIGDPKDEEGNIPPDKIQEAIDGHEFNLDKISEPFRYLKFSITSGYGSETNVYGSEITLFGIDNVQPE